MSYAQFDDDPSADAEAIETQRLDADLEMAEMVATGNAMEAARRRGICCHSSTVGYLPPGQQCHPEQAGLKKGQQACTEHTGGCTAVFEGDDHWIAAIDAALS